MSLEALVVGINIYKYSRLPNLSLPSEDAEAIAKRLKNDGGFRVTRLPEMIEDDDSVRVDPDDTVTIKQLKKAIEQLFLPQGEHPPDTALLYFSGHGLRDDSQIKQGYLATSDVNPDDEKWGLSLKWLRQVLEASPIKRQIIWLDCCYSGELLNFKENLEKETAPGNQEGYNRCFITASRAFEVAFEETSGNHGVLTGALLRGLDPTQQPDGWVTNYSLADFINRELQTETQRPLCHNSGKAIVLTNNQPKKQLGECPYKGLESFNLKDAHFFYGRTALTDELIKRVEKSNFVAVLGASGSGKSSVLSAGLLYKLKRGEDLLGSDRWQFFPPFNPGEHPLDNLKAAIGKEPDKLEQLIATADAERVVLIVDQFEECFTLCKDEECQRFLDCLLGAVERTGNKLCLVLGMRADFLDKCTQYAKLADKIESENLAIVKPLDREELREAITKPAETVGLQVEPRLVVKMIEDVVSSPGRLPLLQDALRELWNEAQKSPDKHLLTLDSYEALEGIEKILEERANKTYDKELKTDAERLVAKRVFLELTYVGEETEVKVTLKPVHKERLVENVSFGESKEVVNRAIAVLEKARLIVTSDAGVVSIAHQALISNWEKLRQWVEENPEARRKKQKIQAASEEWQDKGKSKGYLLQGERLVEAEGFVQSYADTVPLSSLGQEFVKASREESDRLLKEEEERRQRELEQERKARKAAQTRTGVAIVSTVLVSAAAIFAFIKQAEVQKQYDNAKLKADITTANAVFNTRGAEFEGLLKSLEVGKQLRQLKKSGKAEADTQMQVVMELRQVFYGMRETNRLTGHTDTVNGVSFSPDGQTIASASSDNTMKLWKRDGSLIATLKDSDKVYSVSFSPDGQMIASANGDGTVKLWRRDGSLITSLTGHRGSVHSVSFSPDGQTIASGSGDDTIKLWKRDGSLIKTLTGHTDTVYSVSFSPDGQMLASASGSADKTIKLWKRNGSLIATLTGHSYGVNQVSFSPDGQTIASASVDGTIKLWKRNGSLITTLTEHGYGVRGISFSPDGQTIAAASGDTIKLWKRYGSLITTLTGHTSPVSSVSFSPDGQTIASASADKTIKLWKQNGTPITTLTEHLSDGVLGVSFSPDGQTIASASTDHTVKLWSKDGRLITTLTGHVVDQSWYPDGSLTTTFTGHNSPVSSVSFSPDGQTIASAGGDKTIKLWKRDGSLITTLTGHSNAVMDVSFSPDGQLIASAGADKNIKLWRKDGTPITTLTGHSDWVNSVSFSPDGQLIASASKDKTIKLWRKDGTPITTLTGHSDGVNSVSFSPDGQTIASASGDKTIKLWKRDGSLITTLIEYSAAVRDVRFSPDGERLASASWDKTIKLWKRDGSLITTLTGHSDAVTGVSFSPDGQTLASASTDRTVILWNLNLDDLLGHGCKGLHDYLKNPNNGMSKDDPRRHLCDDIKASAR